MKEFIIAIVGGLFIILGAFIQRKVSTLKNRKIKANGDLFELTSRLITLTTEEFYPLKEDYLAEVKEQHKKLNDFFNGNELLFGDKIIEMVKSIENIIEKAIKHLEMIELLDFQGMPDSHKYTEYEALKELYHTHMQKDLPIYREKLKNLTRHN
jgi:hypothetical protein